MLDQLLELCDRLCRLVVGQVGAPACLNDAEPAKLELPRGLEVVDRLGGITRS